MVCSLAIFDVNIEAISIRENALQILYETGWRYSRGVIPVWFPEGAVKIGNIGKAHKIRDFVDADPGSD